MPKENNHAFPAFHPSARRFWGILAAITGVVVLLSLALVSRMAEEHAVYAVICPKCLVQGTLVEKDLGWHCYSKLTFRKEDPMPDGCQEFFKDGVCPKNLSMYYAEIVGTPCQHQVVRSFGEWFTRSKHKTGSSPEMKFNLPRIQGTALIYRGFLKTGDKETARKLLAQAETLFPVCNYPFDMSLQFADSYGLYKVDEAGLAPVIASFLLAEADKSRLHKLVQFRLLLDRLKKVQTAENYQAALNDDSRQPGAGGQDIAAPPVQPAA